MHLEFVSDFPPVKLHEINQFMEREAGPWFLYWMVAHFTMRTYGIKQRFRFVKGI